jgi:hypothetical protein
VTGASARVIPAEAALVPVAVGVTAVGVASARLTMAVVTARVPVAWAVAPPVSQVPVGVTAVDVPTPKNAMSRLWFPAVVSAGAV